MPSRQARYKTRYLALALTCATLTLLEISQAEAAAPLYAVEANNGLFYELNPSDGSLVSARMVSLNGIPDSIFGFTGLATHPFTGELFALARTSDAGPPPRVLVTIDPDTGMATEIGDPGVRLNSLAFDADGTLYAVGGTNTANDGRLLTISTVDATVEDFTGISGGGGQPNGGGHNIAFNPDDGLLYHIYDAFNFQMESINLDDGSTTAVPVSGDAFQNILGFTYESSESQFLAANNSRDWLTITASGLSTEVGTGTFGGEVARGMAFGLIPAVCDFDENGTCDFSDLDLLQSLGPIAGSGVPAVGNEEFDLNGDGTINLTDRDQWLSDAAIENNLSSPYQLGDANTDGTVDGQDFIRWNAAKFTSSLLWSAGNFNGDGTVDGQDFILWNANKFTSSDAVSAVPEPATGLLTVLGFSFLGLGSTRPSNRSPFAAKSP